MSTSGDSSFGGSPLQYYQSRPFSMEEIDAFNSTAHFTTNCSTASTIQAAGSSTTTYRRTQPYSPASVGTPATCSSDESLPDGLGDQEDESLGTTTTVGGGRVHKKIRRIQANKRERKRMHTVNSAFDDLRDLVPTYPTNRKLSKIETLRLACAYIQDLAKLLNESNAATVHGEDVNLHMHQTAATGSSHHHLPPPHHYDGFMTTTAPQQQPTTGPPQQQTPNGVFSPVKTEFNIPADYNNTAPCNSFKHYRIPLSYDYESCPSDPELQSPPNYHATTAPGVYMMPPGLAVKPPALARVSSDTAVSLQLSQTSLNNGTMHGGNNSSGYCGSPAGPIAPCSPLTRVTHSSPSQHRNLPVSHFTATSSYYNPISSSSSSSFMPLTHHHHPHSRHHTTNTIPHNGYGLATQCYSQ